MCLVWAALSSVLTCWTINWLMEYTVVWYGAGVVSPEKVGEGEELDVEQQLQVAQEERN